ncbi:N-acetylmuramoyl-L-alanine amidase [Clostridium sp.]|jgi:N-acetylmuramoyl-L-alanine amidase|uniref:N-acetylmuramoyl-L-alanine amidase n=1 Tax=Clostridium sp. TaxID=1506 RepID=UPI003EEB15AF
MSKDAIRGGHNYQSTGAHALLDEVTEDRLVKDATIKYLKLAEDETVDATPGNCTQSVDLKFGTDTANNAKADLYVPEHFNKAYDKYVGAIGSEIWINPGNAKSIEVGTRILNNLEALGFKNRGLKNGMTQHRLHDIRQSHMAAVLVETCFVEATEDVRIYKLVGADRVGKAIAEGIVGHAINIGAPVTTIETVTLIAVPKTRVNNSIAQLQAELNKQGAHLLVDGFFGPKTLAVCPLLRFGAQGNITKWLQKRLAFKLKLQDGDFGPLTKGAVKNYQVALRLSSDGVVGKNTWAALLR